jgi:hypothetical protein
MLLQQDSKLYIMDAKGGTPRLMNCNMKTWTRGIRGHLMANGWYFLQRTKSISRLTWPILMRMAMTHHLFYLKTWYLKSGG